MQIEMDIPKSSLCLNITFQNQR